MTTACPQPFCLGHLAPQAPRRCDACDSVALFCAACRAANRPDAVTCTHCGAPYKAAPEAVRPLAEVGLVAERALPFSTLKGLWLEGHVNGVALGQAEGAFWFGLGPAGWGLHELPWRTRPIVACGHWFWLIGDRLVALRPHQVAAVASGALRADECPSWSGVDAVLAAHPDAVWIRRGGQVEWAERSRGGEALGWKPWHLPFAAQASALGLSDLLWHEPAEGRLVWCQRGEGGAWVLVAEGTRPAWRQDLVAAALMAEGRLAVQWAGGPVVQLRPTYGALKDEAYPTEVLSNLEEAALLPLGNSRGAVALRTDGVVGLDPFGAERLPAFSRRLSLPGGPAAVAFQDALWLCPQNAVGRQELLRLEVGPSGWGLPQVLGDWAQLGAMMPAAGRAFVVQRDPQKGWVLEVLAWA